MIRWLPLVLVLACRSEEPEIEPTPEPDPYASMRQAVLTDLERNLADRASVAVWIDEEIVWVGGFGQRPARDPGPDTLFMLGSDTKKLTAISVLRQVADGRLTLDTTVGGALPDLEMQRVPAFLDATVHDLLTMQGGIVDGAQFGVSTTDEALETYALGSFARTAYPLLPPGVAFNYSNPNFSIAGLIDERLAPAPWADTLREGVLDPLGMTRTVPRKAEVDEDHTSGVGRALPNDPDVRPVGLADIWESAYTRPAGLVWSTPTDHLRVVPFLVDGDPHVG